MITKVQSYQVGQQLFPTIVEAQKHELALLLAEVPDANTGKRFDADSCQDIADAIVANADKVLNVLTMKPESHPRARKANGAKRKPRTPNPSPVTTVTT